MYLPTDLPTYVPSLSFFLAEFFIFSARVCRQDSLIFIITQLCKAEVFINQTREQGWLYSLQESLQIENVRLLAPVKNFNMALADH